MNRIPNYPDLRELHKRFSTRNILLVFALLLLFPIVIFFLAKPLTVAFNVHIGPNQTNITASSGSATASGNDVSLTTTMGITVSGNQLLRNGTPIVLHGVAQSGMEYACVQNFGYFDLTPGTNDASPTGDTASINAMASWTGDKAMSLLLNEDCWNNTGACPANCGTYSGTNYRTAVTDTVNEAEAAGLTPIISLTWGSGASACTSGCLGQFPMPKAVETPNFWQSVANAFKSDHNVIFRLSEEPWPANSAETSAAWNCWYGGNVQYDTAGQISGNVSHCSEPYSTVGMQSLVNIIRATGATNVIQVPGLAYANELSCGASPSTCGFLASATHVVDTLNPSQLMAAVDTYATSNVCNTPSCFNTQYDPVATVMPLFAGEIGQNAENTDDVSFGSSPGITEELDWFDAHSVGYLGWAWNNNGFANQDLVTNTELPTVQSPWGVYFKARLATFTGGLSATGGTATAGGGTVNVTGGTGSFIASGWWLAYGSNDPSLAAFPWSDVNQMINFTDFINASGPTWTNSSQGTTPTEQTNFVTEVHSHDMKALLAIGGAGNNGWTTACTTANMASFTSYLVNQLHIYHYDGIDLDIEDNGILDYQNLMDTCVTGVANAIHAANVTGGPFDGQQLWVTGDVISGWAEAVWAPTDQYLDQVNLMDYGSGCTAANCNQVANSFAANTSLGVPMNKLVEGIESYNQDGSPHGSYVTLGTLNGNATSSSIPVSALGAAIPAGKIYLSTNQNPPAYAQVLNTSGAGIGATSIPITGSPTLNHSYVTGDLVRSDYKGPPDCGNVAEYSKSVGAMGVAIFTPQLDFDAHNGSLPCFDAVAPYKG